MRFFSFDSVWEGGCGRHVPHVLPHGPPPHARVDSECKRWNLEHVVLDLFSHFTLGKVQDRCLFVSCRGSRSPNSPFALSRLANLTHAVAARRSRARRRSRAHQTLDEQFLHSLQLSWKLAATCNRHRPSEADIARERKLLQLRVIYLCDRFGISKDHIWNLDETAVRMVPASERGWTIFSRINPCLRLARLRFVTVSLAANMWGGIWTQIVYEDKSDRVRPRGPFFPRQLVTHSPTHWITQDALLDMIDAIDADMHARPGDAEQRNFIAYTQAVGPSAHASLQELDPQRGGQTLRRVFLGSRVQLRTCQSGLQHRGAPTAAAGWRFTDWNEVEQRELLAEAKRLLETGELFPRGTAEEPHAPDAEAEATDCEPEAHVMEPMADDHSSDGEDTHTCVEESATPAAPAVAAAPERAAMSLLERLQAIRIIFGCKPPS